jgi:hypothetical protein
VVISFPKEEPMGKCRVTLWSMILKKFKNRV